MSDCLLILYWPDFSGTSRASHRISPSLFAATLYRRVSLLFEENCCYVWDPSGGPDPSAAIDAFPRWGFRPVAEPFEPARAAALVRQHPDLDHVVLLMSAERAQSILPLLEGMGRRIQVGLPDGSPESGLTVPTRAVEDALHLETAHSVGLFVDWRTVLQNGRIPSTTGIDALRGPLLQQASLVGTVTTARVYGPWDGRASLELAGTAPGADLRDLRFRGLDSHEGEEELQADLWLLLDDPDAPQTWILVSDAAWLSQLIARAHGKGIRVLLWPPDPQALPAGVLAEVDGHAELPQLPAQSALPRFRPVLDHRPTAEQRPTVEPRAAALHHGIDADDFQPEPATTREVSHPIHVDTGHARLNSWMRLIYHTECMLRRNGWSKVAFRKLAARLAELDEFGPTPANAMMWLNRAKAEGLLVVDQEVHRADPSLRVTVCRPNPDHPVARLALDVPDRCLRLLHQMLHKIPWVSFKLLRNVLLREQWLGGPPYRLDEAAIDEWLNFLIAESAIRMAKEPNLVNPDYPVTALRLHEEHPFSRAVATDVTESARMAAERAILAVDHFLKRQRKPWMAMSALRRTLESLGREELQTVLQGLQNLGALVTESYPNPQREHFTTGCRLKNDVPLVSSVLETRDSIIRVTQYHQRYRSWVPLAKLDEDLSAQESALPSAQVRLAWYLLLRDEGILEMDPDAGITQETWEHVRCRLNVADAVVRAVVAEAGDVTGEARITVMEA